MEAIRGETSRARRRVNISLFHVGLDRKSLNAFQLCNALTRRGHEVLVTAVGTGYEHAWFPLAVKPRYVRPSSAGARTLVDHSGNRVPCDLSLHRTLDALADAMPDCDINLCLDTPSLQAAAEAGRGEAWLWVQDGLQRSHAMLAAASALCLAARRVYASSSLASLAGTSEGEHFEILRPGIDQEVFYPMPGHVLSQYSKPTAGKERLLICLGEEGDWLGLETLEKAVAVLKDSFSFRAIGLCGTTASVGERAGGLEFRFPVRPSETAELFRKADAVVGSYPQGTFPLQPLEAMACGAPVVIASDPALDYADDGVDALMVRPGDAQALSEAIIEMLTNRPLARALGENAARRAAEYSWERTASDFEALVERSRAKSYT
ncbi:MAG: glycosyltransferase family 4 protein [Actinobacteria bacterium]|nr:glycosyltransferase family 4 protein [Actinomycetota bacterium]